MTPLPRLACPKCARSPLRIAEERSRWGRSAGLVAHCPGCGWRGYDAQVRDLIGTSPTPAPQPKRTRKPPVPVQYVKATDPDGNPYLGIAGTACRHCGRPTTTRDQVYCSRRCQDAAKWQRIMANRPPVLAPVPNTQCAADNCNRPCTKGSKYCHRYCKNRMARKRYNERHGRKRPPRGSVVVLERRDPNRKLPARPPARPVRRETCASHDEADMWDLAAKNAGLCFSAWARRVLNTAAQEWTEDAEP